MKKLIVCNQKMYLTPDEAKELNKDLNDINTCGNKLVICPNYLNFFTFTGFDICAQDCHFEDSGAYTTNISPYHLSLLNCKYVLLGHSEVRDYECI